MSEKVQEYLSKKRKVIFDSKEREREEILIQEGLFEKVYTDATQYTEEFPCYEWDNESQRNRYYKQVVCEVTDEEYEEILKYVSVKEGNSNNKNMIANVLSVMAWITFAVGFIAGCSLGTEEVTRGYYSTYTEEEFSLTVAFIYWVSAFISGMFMLAFAEIIKLLDDIKNK